MNSNVENDCRRRKLVPPILNIPPRVVIDLLSYLGCKLDVYSEDGMEHFDTVLITTKYGLFGYFKKDRLRNILMIFTTLLIPKSQLLKYYIIRFRNLRYLSLDVYCNRNVVVTISKIPFFHLLEKLEVKNYNVINYSAENQVDLFDTLLSEPNTYSSQEKWIKVSKQICRFGNLKRLKISGYSGSATSWNQFLFENLYELELIICRNISSVFTHHDFSNLKKLKMDQVNFKEPAEYLLPNIRILVLKKCSNISFKGCSRVENLIIYECSAETTKQIIRISPYLKELSIGYIRHDINPSINDSMNWFLNYFENRLEFLENLKFDSLDTFSGTSKNIMLDKCKFLVSIEIWKCSNLQEEFFFTEIKSLKYLEFFRLSGFRYTGREKLKMLLNLEDLSISWCEKLDNKIFRENEIPYLKRIYLSGFKGKGRDWKDWPELKSMSFSNGSMDSSFFNMKQKFCDKLEVIRCFNIEKNGQNMSRKQFKNVKKMELKYMDFLTDICFSENSFRKLRELKLQSNDVLEGVGWKKYRNLRNLTVDSCKKFGDSFFVEHASPLVYLEIRNCPALKGENWKFMEGLRDFFICGIENCMENLTKNKPFPENCCFIYSNDHVI